MHIRSLNQKPYLSGQFWFRTTKVRPDPLFGPNWSTFDAKAYQDAIATPTPKHYTPAPLDRGIALAGASVTEHAVFVGCLIVA